MKYYFFIAFILSIGCKTTEEKPITSKPAAIKLAQPTVLENSETNTPMPAQPQTTQPVGPAKPDPNIAKYMKEKVSYMGGYLGQVGTKKIFYASTSVIPDYDRLYWVMVAVLSKKFGCFMESRYELKNKMLFKCRDGRLVDFNRRITENWALFGARQFDAYGREIVVKNRKVVGIGNSRVIVPEDMLD